MSFKITEQCTGCRACVTTCPTGAIRGESQGLHVIDPAKCIDCGACGVICRDDAVFDHHGSLFSLCDPAEGPCAWVDLALCSDCGWCRSTCMWDAITPVVVRGLDGSARRFAGVDASRCVACGSCEVECASDAIRVLRPSDPSLGELRARNRVFLVKYAEVEGSALGRERVASARDG